MTNVFGCQNNDDFKTLKFFMSQPIVEPYNKGYNWIVANSRPVEGAFEPGQRFYMKQDKIKILSSYPDAQPDELFFYERGGKYGNCFMGQNLKISQYIDGGNRNFTICPEIFPKGLFMGNPMAISLASKLYVNPMPLEHVEEMTEFDIRQKSNYIFPNLATFSKVFFKNTGGGNLDFTDGGIYYVDAKEEADLTLGGSISNISFNDNVMLIFRGNVKVPSISKSIDAKNANATMTIVSIDGDITIAGRVIEASLNSLSGTIKKTVDYFQIFGNLTMNKIVFDLKSPGNLFKVSSFPAGNNTKIIGTKDSVSGFERISVMYDPALDPCNYDNYMRHYKFTLSSKQTYWRSASEK